MHCSIKFDIFARFSRIAAYLQPFVYLKDDDMIVYPLI